MQTQSVDSKFEEVLKEKLPESNTRVHIDGDDEVEDEDKTKVDPELLKPVSEYTKNLIACKFAGALNNDPVATQKMMGVLKSLESASEGEARLFLKSIETSDISLMSDRSVTYLLRYISKHFVNPNNHDAMENILHDRYVRSALSHKMTEAFCYLGTWAGVFLFIVYAVESWSSNTLTQLEDEKSKNPTDHNSKDTN
jgi:hypothetical protein